MKLTHPAIDLNALGRLRQHLGLSEPVDTVEASSPVAQGAATAAGRARALARRLAAPMVERARAELALGAAGQQAVLQAEVDELRRELVRTRTAHAAELAVLHEELRSR